MADPVKSVLYRARYLHTPGDAFAADTLEVVHDGGLLVRAGRIEAAGDFAAVRAEHPDAQVVRLGGLLMPGLVDTHVHYPQLRVLGGLGMPLLEWLDRNTLPEEARLSDAGYARTLARDFLRALAGAGTTTALVFGSHYRAAMEAFFEEAHVSGLRVVAGQVLSDRLLRPELHVTPEQAREDSLALIERFHGRGRLLYAVTPRFSLSASDAMLEVCGELMNAAPGVRFTSHINENRAEIETVRELFPWARDYLDTYERYGLVGPSSVLAHSVHPQDRELEAMAHLGCAVAHCPCSNSALGSGFFPLRRHLRAGVRVSLGSDVGGGTGFSLFKEALQAYFVQQLIPAAQALSADAAGRVEVGEPLTPARMLYLATLAGAEALGLADEVGDFRPDKRFDAVQVLPGAGTPLDLLLQHADSDERLVAALFTQAGPADVARVWVDGDTVHERPCERSESP